MPKSEDGRSFTEIYNRHKTGIYHFCRRMLADGDEAKDVVQEVFVKFFENRVILEGDTQIKVWLFKSARNRCLNYIRDKGKLSNIGDGEEPVDSSTIVPESGDSATIVAKLLDNLPSDYREILIMREWSELSYEEIAETLDTTVSAVKSRLFKARKKALEIYERFFGDE